MLHLPNPQHIITADASGSLGCGAFGSHGRWFQLQWPQSCASHHIAAKELVPVVMAIALWGAQWQATTVLVRSDNTAVLAALMSGSAKDPLLMHLLRCLHLHLVARHLAGVENTAADALSRDNLTVFLQCQPLANPSPLPLQPALKELLLLKSLDWLSPTWRALFLATLHSP